MGKITSHKNYQYFYEIIKANAPVADGGTKLFDGDRDYLMQIPELNLKTLC